MERKPGQHDNWPFMHALLKIWAGNRNYSYNNECSLAHHKDTNPYFVFKKFYACYTKHLSLIGKRSTHSSCTERCGSTLMNDSNILGVWDLNLGLDGFSPPNNWKPGSFLIHFAGTGTKDRTALMIEYANKTTY